MYKYEIWHDGSCIMDRTGADDCEYETEEEALAEANSEAENKIQEWKDDDAWSGETVEDFDIRIKEM